MAKKDVNIENAVRIDHIAFIMDGNGRWAQKRGMPREYGHKFGAETLKKVIRRCCELGIKVSTFYAFSTENWKRPEKEVNALMDLLDKYLDELAKEVSKNDIRYIFIGDISVLNDDLKKKIYNIEEISKNNTYKVNIALNYGARSELAAAYSKLVAKGKERVSEEDISSALYTAGCPELDLLVRTGGDLRLSNFLLWQAAYAELYFTDVLWPDFSTDEVDRAIEVFRNRKRRFGGV